MSTLKYAYEDTVLLLEDEVIEIFSRVVTGSGRTPLAWAGVQLTPKKGDKLEVKVGTCENATDAFYNDSVNQTGPYAFVVPASEEATLRTFFDEAARRAGRSSSAG